MKSLLIRQLIKGCIVLLLLSWTGRIQAQDFDIIQTIPAPDKSMGLTWDGEYIWVTDDLFKKYRQLDPQTGEIVRSIDYHETVLFSQGMAFDSKFLWANGWEDPNGAGSKLIKIDTAIYEIVSVIDYPGGYNDNWPHGMTYAGSSLWVSNFKTKTLDRIDPNSAELIGTLPAPGNSPIGIAWDGEFLWTNDYETALIYKQDISDGTVLGNITMPASNCRGMEWDTLYLWTNSFGTGTIYRVDIQQLGIKDIVDPIFSIYPNPAKDHFYLSLAISQQGKMNISISDLKGKTLLELPVSVTAHDSGRIPVDVSDLAPGIYLVRIETAGKNSARKLLIAR